MQYLSDQICVWTQTQAAQPRDACGAPWRSYLAGDSVSQLALLTGSARLANTMSAGVDARTLRSKLEQQAKQAMSAQQPADVNVYMRWALLLQAELRRLSTTIESERAETRALSEQNLVLRDRLAIHAPGHPLLAGKGVGAGAAAAAASSRAAALRAAQRSSSQAPSAGTSDSSTPNRGSSTFSTAAGPRRRRRRRWSRTRSPGRGGANSSASARRRTGSRPWASCRGRRGRAEDLRI